MDLALKFQFSHTAWATLCPPYVPFRNVPNLCYPSHSLFCNGQVVWADIRWRYLRRARVPRATGVYALNPRLLDVFGDPRRVPYMITRAHRLIPYIRTLNHEHVVRPGCYHYTTEFPEPFPAGFSRVWVENGQAITPLISPPFFIKASEQSHRF